MRQIVKPTRRQVEAFLAEQSVLPFSYDAVGASNTVPPKNFDINHRRVSLGHGEAVFQVACGALLEWKMFPQGWTEIQPTGASQQPGSTVAVLIRCFGHWWLNASRVVYSIVDDGPTRRFGFAYGTLPGHVESGEERFMVELDLEGNVWYEIYAFSRPQHWLVRLGYPLARRLQLRFIRESMSVMQQICAAESEMRATPCHALQ